MFVSLLGRFIGLFDTQNRSIFLRSRFWRSWCCFCWRETRRKMRHSWVQSIYAAVFFRTTCSSWAAFAACWRGISGAPPRLNFSSGARHVHLELNLCTSEHRFAPPIIIFFARACARKALDFYHNKIFAKVIRFWISFLLMFRTHITSRKIWRGFDAARLISILWRFVFPTSDLRVSRSPIQGKEFTWIRQCGRLSHKSCNCLTLACNILTGKRR